MKLVNGNTSVRVRGSEGCAVLPCGCAYTDTKYWQMCDPCWEVWSLLHEVAAKDHAEQNLIRSLTEEL
jgi:hypothetical protein